MKKITLSLLTASLIIGCTKNSIDNEILSNVPTWFIVTSGGEILQVTGSTIVANLTQTLALKQNPLQQPLMVKDTIISMR